MFEGNFVYLQLMNTINKSEPIYHFVTILLL